MANAWNNGYVSNSPCCQKRRAEGKAPAKVAYVNGIKTEKAAQCQTLQKIANQTCATVIGVHNSTGGMVSDLLQSRKDRNLIDRVRAGKPVPLADG